MSSPWHILERASHSTPAKRAGLLSELAASLADTGRAQDRGPDDRTLLHIAADLGWVDAVELLLDAGADPNAVSTQQQQTPLFAPVAYNESAIIGRLLEAGALATLTDASGLTPLHYAARMGADTAISQLLERGAVIDAQDPYGFTPLMEAILAGHQSSVAQLCGQQADPLVALTQDYPPFHKGDNAIDLALTQPSQDILRLVASDAARQTT